MKRLLFALFASALFAPAAARAQFVNLHIDLPEVPPLVVVSPGVQVVENHDEEIFFHDSWYWVRREGHWYRARHPRAEFVYVEERSVPHVIYGVPPGRYRHYHHEMREEHRLRAEEARMREHEMRQREEERRLREREMRQREEERRFHEREEAERRRERREDRHEMRREERHEERREERHEMRHEERRDAHPAVPVQGHGERHENHPGGHEHH